ncbi:hypothetical protein GCM10027592_51840 [Spirosoma flavus]
MRLKVPTLGADEFEVRIWQKCQLCFGEAHELYLLEKRTKKFTLTKYKIRSDKQGFRDFTKVKSIESVPDSVWMEFVQLDILTPPDYAAIDRQLHPRHKDSTYTSIEPDGSINVHAKKFESSVWVSDGESYHVDVFGQNSHQQYEHGNPQSYLRAKPKVKELQKFVAILDKLNALFQHHN